MLMIASALIQGISMTLSRTSRQRLWLVALIIVPTILALAWILPTSPTAKHPVASEAESRALGDIRGTVTVVEGNCQPGEPGVSNAISCNARPVRAKVYLYKPPILVDDIEDTYYTGRRKPSVIG